MKIKKPKKLKKPKNLTFQVFRFLKNLKNLGFLKWVSTALNIGGGGELSVGIGWEVEGKIERRRRPKSREMVKGEPEGRDGKGWERRMGVNGDWEISFQCNVSGDIHVHRLRRRETVSG